MPGPVHKTNLSDGFCAYHLGAPLEMGPLPAFFYFSLSGPDSLAMDPYNQPAAFLEGEGVRIFSLSLPFHDDIDKRRVMTHWADEIAANHDFITPFIDRCVKAVDELIDMEAIDPGRLALGGLSRGSFIAAHLAARDPRFGALVGFAPLTKLSVSTSFHDRQGSSLLSSLSLDRVKEELVKRPIRFYIGNRDTMVQTSACFEFVVELTELAFSQGTRSPEIELIISPSIGYKGHGTAPETFLSGANWIKLKLGLNT